MKNIDKHEIPTFEPVSEVILPLCKGELEGVEPSLNMIYPP